MEKTQEELQAQGAAVRANSDQPRKNDSAYLNMLDDIGKMLEDLADSVSFGGGGVLIDHTADYNQNTIDLVALGFVATKPIEVIVTFTPTSAAADCAWACQVLDNLGNFEPYAALYLPAAAIDSATSHTLSCFIDFSIGVADISSFDLIEMILTNMTINKVWLKQ